jgi:sugar/nucleoside kinase (ribokinase family)
MITVYGTVCVDRVRRVASLPAKGGYAEILAETALLGGEAANTAVCLAAWGAPPRLIGNPIGRGADAEFLRSRMAFFGVDDAEVPADDGPTPFCDVYVTDDGDRTMFGRGFGDLEHRVGDRAWAASSGDWFAVDPNHGSAARSAVRAAAAQGARPYLLDFVRADDPLGPEWVWQSSTDWAGTRGHVQRNVAFVRDLVARCGGLVVLSDGPNGFVAGSPRFKAQAFPPYPCPDLVDSTGAGDTFRAGMLLGLDEGWGLADCLRFASAAGALACRALGATSRPPSREEILAWLDAHPEVGHAYEIPALGQTR